MTRTIRQRCQNCLLSLQWDTLTKAKFFQKVFSFCCVIGFWAVFFDIWHKIFCKVVKSAFYVFRRTLWLRNTVLKDSSSFFWIWSKSFLTFGKNVLKKNVETVFYIFRKHFEETDFSFFFLVLLHFRILGKSSQRICIKFSERLLKLQSTCSE